MNEELNKLSNESLIHVLTAEGINAKNMARRLLISTITERNIPLINILNNIKVRDLVKIKYRHGVWAEKFSTDDYIDILKRLMQGDHTPRCLVRCHKKLPTHAFRAFMDKYFPVENSITTCEICNRPLAVGSYENREWVIGHIVNCLTDSCNVIRNLRPVCRTCNSKLNEGDIYTHIKSQWTKAKPVSPPPPSPTFSNSPRSNTIKYDNTTDKLSVELHKKCNELESMSVELKARSREITHLRRRVHVLEGELEAAHMEISTLKSNAV